MVFLLVVLVTTLKVAELAPGAMLTLPGTVATVVLLLVSVTTAPLVAAGLARVTVPTEVEPPTTLNGFSVSYESTAGAAAFTVRFADLLTPA